MKVKMVSKSGRYPAYQTEGSSGMDLQAFLTEDLVFQPGERKAVPTGLFMELPQGYEAQIRARSGLSLKFGMTLVNGVGTIDSDYRGEIKVAMINLGQEPYTIHDGDRIAQMIVARYERVDWQPADSLEETERGEGGFGHTGKE
ncbi:MAG: dUTP diphosphatase [Clostridiales bacterium]|nr:dUTP diphosphatase [Clostridiales bacterium]